MEFDEIGTIQIYVDEETNKYVVEFIRLDEETNYDGLWQRSRPISKKEIKKIYKILEQNTDLETIDEWEENLHKRG